MAGLIPTGRHDIHELLGVEILEATGERVVMRLPIDWKVHQPYGILHGGVSALLAESAASFGGALAAQPGRGVVGIELNASHLRSVSDGHLTAVATTDPGRPHRAGLGHRPDRRPGPSHLRGPLHPGRDQRSHRPCRRRERRAGHGVGGSALSA